MIPKGLFSQVGMIVVAAAILITYVQPAFDGIASVQDSIEVYNQEIGKVVDVNSNLATLVTKLQSVSNEDQRQLITYMPDSVDVIAVPRDLTLITNEAGVLYKNAIYVGEIDSAASESAKHMQLPSQHSFTLAVEGTYSQFKNLFRLLEQNHYPLEVREANIQQIDGGFLTAQIDLIVYSYQEPIDSINQIVF
ncbi:MAG: hypothetical protein LR008_00305 [Candidatus Pacebacteria bacterium]|nr:hypothetical protein [Candidatus Paceibacterota bacterium]